MANRLTRGTAIVGDLQVISGGKVQKAIIGTIARTDTVAKTLGTLPNGSTILNVSYGVPVASDAGTTGTISVGYNGGSGTELINAASVKTTGQLSVATTAQSGTAVAAAKTVTGLYAETGTASTTGGPFPVIVTFVTV
jgi:hypothetical protein